ncbi:hypothetical protein IFM89_005534 [Coptis chinensis]|uniref:Uncharacterized protein n=1 Tax=Coptis chinensis TaxID=261450 RepID=A0A835I941_9MAGN|nr:hypothetical protein IFM89_005534 [Coptis chinensis]
MIVMMRLERECNEIMICDSEFQTSKCFGEVVFTILLTLRGDSTFMIVGLYHGDGCGPPYSECPSYVVLIKQGLLVEMHSSMELLGTFGTVFVMVSIGKRVRPCDLRLHLMKEISGMPTSMKGVTSRAGASPDVVR